MKQITTLIKDNKIIIYLAVALGLVYTYWVYKIRGAVKEGVTAGGKAGGAIAGSAMSVGIPIMASVAGFIQGLKGTPKTAVEKQKEAEQKALRDAAVKAENAKKIQAAIAPDAIQVRKDRANMLIKKFAGTGSRVRFLQPVNCSQVTTDIWGAVKETGTKKLFPVKTFERNEAFLKTVTKTGYLLFLDNAAKKLYSVNPHSITLV